MRLLLFILLFPCLCAAQTIHKYGILQNVGGTISASEGLTETIVMPTSITLDWRSVANADSYTVQRSTSRDYSSPVIIYSWIPSTCIDTGLTTGTWYYYRVRALSATGNVSIWVTDSARTSSSSYDPDAQRFIDSAGITDNTQQAALHALVYALKLDTLWDKIIVACPLLGGTYATAKWNLRYPYNDDLAYRPTQIGTPTFNSAGMTPSSGNALNSKFIPAAAGLDATTGMHMSYYSATSQSPVNGYIMGIYQYAYIAPAPDGASYVRVGASHNSGTGQNSLGFHLVNRPPSSSSQRYLHDGSVIINATQTFVNYNTNIDNEVYVGALNDGTDLYSTVQCGFYSIGMGLTTSQEANLRNRITTFLTAIGR